MMSSLDTSSPVSASTLRYRVRCPVFLLIWLKLIFSDSEVAGNNAIGHVTRDSRKKPFQLARGAMNSTPPILKNRLNIGGRVGMWSPDQQSGQESPIERITSSKAAIQASGVAPGYGFRQASSRARFQASGSE